MSLAILWPCGVKEWLTKGAATTARHMPALPACPGAALTLEFRDMKHQAIQFCADLDLAGEA